MPHGISVELSDGYALITFPDPSLRGPTLGKLAAIGTPIKVDTSGRHTRGYRVPEGNAREIGLLDVPVVALTPTVAPVRAVPVATVRAPELFVPRAATPPLAPAAPTAGGPRVVLFVFAGRRPNMELQLPLIRRILEENPNVEYDIWDLARTPGDSRYLRTIKGERMTVRTEFAKATLGYDHVYRYYAKPAYKGSVFVKLDDDIVFLQTDAFRRFVQAVETTPDAVISANVINNGACTRIDSELFSQFETLGIPLLEVHKSQEYAALSHQYFFDHYRDLLQTPAELVTARDWLSINTIGYSWDIACRIARKVGSVCGTSANPKQVAGRALTTLGDEGVVNTLPRRVMRGFLACHLTFGPQKLTPAQLRPWRKRYAEITKEMLHADRALLPVS